MRRLILQMQATIDGFVEAGDDCPWQVWDWGPVCTWDRPLQKYFNEVYAQADCLLLSRPMAEQGFIDHWGRLAVEQAKNPAFDFARRVGTMEKVIATRRGLSCAWDRARVVTGPLDETVPALKAASGGDILTFGGVSFASALLGFGLVDELQLFVNPVAVGHGRTIFGAQPSRYRLLGAESYECGIVVGRYVPLIKDTRASAGKRALVGGD